MGGKERRRGRNMGGKGEPGHREKEGNGMEGINLPHGCLKTLAALIRPQCVDRRVLAVYYSAMAAGRLVGISFSC